MKDKTMIGANVRSILELSFLLIIFLIEVVTCSNYTNQDELYGLTWMYFPDGDGVPQVAYLTEESGRRRGGGGQRNVREHVFFELYTRKSSRQPKVTQFGRRRKRSVDEFVNNFQKDLPTYIIVHGWKSGTDSDTVQNIKDNYLRTRNCNVIGVDWSQLTSNNFYITPARQAREVGKYVAEMIDFLVAEDCANINKFHLIGHSLGAHTVGFAANYVKSGRIKRITGLDPAKPMFEHFANDDGCLDQSDAEFVDIIHSCTGMLGYSKSMGHVDFYPNGGGPPQPGCRGIATELREACSHGRSHQYFAESILHKGFIAYKCRSYDDYDAGRCKEVGGIPMGDSTPYWARGVYYLKTSDKSPFSISR